MKLEDYILDRYSEKSVPRYMNQINLFRATLGEKAEESNYSDIVSYIGELRKRGLHPKSLRNHLFSLKIYFRYLVETEKRQEHPCENLQLKDQINREIIIEELYSKEDLEELYKTYQSKANKTKFIKIRDRIILSLLIYQALTTNEIIELRKEDVSIEEGEVKVREVERKNRRGNKGRILALHPKQMLLVNEYYQMINEGCFIQTEKGKKLYSAYVSRMLRHHSKYFTPIKIRQSVIANLLKEKNDIRVVQEFAGHRRTGSTEAYKRTGLEELKSSIERLHPRQ
jgi:site-specific recombinase XerD